MNALTRGLDILEALTRASGPQGVTDLALALDLDKSTVHRLLGHLIEAGYVEQDPDTRKYRPTSKLVWMGSQLLGRFDVRKVGTPFLRQLALDTGFASHLVVMAQRRVLYVSQERSPSTITVDMPIGGVAPLTCTAVGKVLLADIPAEERDAFIDDLEPHTPRTITDRRALDAELDLIRERGYAIDDEEFHLGVRCVAAAVRDHAGKAKAAVGVSGPATDLTPDRVPAVAAMVREVAGTISARMGSYG